MARGEAEMNNFQRIAVTGATGFLGSHLTERLLNEGYTVRILARDNAEAKRFESRVEKTISADIGDKRAVAELVNGVDVVIHLVSNFRTASGPPDSYYKVNVQGTINALEAAQSANVQRFIHCSTIGVHGHVESTPADEDSPYNPGDLYQETKMHAELACRTAMQNNDMEIVILRPCSMYGPGDMRMLKMFKMLAKRVFFLVGPCRENFHAVYIDDVVEAFVRAINFPGLNGETIIIGGATYQSLESYINVAARAVGAPAPFLRFPYWLFYSAAVSCEGVCVPFRIEPPLHRRRVRFYRNNRAFCIDKARRLLHCEPRVNLEEGMRLTVACYRQDGYLDDGPVVADDTA